MILMAASLSFLFTIIPVHADGNTINTSASGFINLRINQDEWYVEGTTFHLYQVETISSDLTFTKTEAFRNADIDLKPVNLTGEQLATATKWMKASSGLISYVRKNHIAENDEKQMYNRSLQFNNLVPGLYLIQGDTGREGNRTVTYQPILICVPQRSNASEQWNYNISAVVKSADPTYTYPSNNPGKATSTPETTPAPGTGTSPQPGKTPVPGETEVPSDITTSPQPSGTSSVPGNSQKTDASPKPSASSDQSADTGDTFRAELYAGVLIAMAVVIGIVIYIRNKERKD